MHVETPAAITLLRQVGGARDGAPTAVCEAPCDRVVEGRADHQYFVEGAGVPRSGPFDLGETGSWKIVVDPGSSAQRYAGIPLAVFGGVGAVVGSALMVGRAFDDGYDDGLFLGGGVSLAVGLAVLTTGIVLMATSGTGVEVHRLADATTMSF